MHLLLWLLQQGAELQRAIYLPFAERIRLFAETGEWMQLAVFLPMAIVFGAVHAATPGHSKIILATYSAGSATSLTRAVGVSFILSATHVAMAVAIALFSLPLLDMGLQGVGRAPSLEAMSRGLVGLIGLWMLWQAVRRQPVHGHEDGQGAAFGVMAGLIPCPLTLFVMTFAITHKVPQAGLAFACFMVVGVAATLSGVAVTSVFFRQGMLRLAASRPRTLEVIGRAIHGAAALILIAIAVYAVLRATS